MDHKKVEADVARRSALVYLPLSLGAGALFYAAASLRSLAGDHALVTRVGGALWVALLSLIVSMPIVISHIRRNVTKRRLSV